MSEPAEKIIIEGTEYQIPGEDDWELGEIAEFNRLRDKWGDMGSTIAVVWIAKHRVEPQFTIEQAERVKVSQVESAEEPATVPLVTSDGSSENGLSSLAPSETPADSGHPMLQGTTG